MAQAFPGFCLPAEHPDIAQVIQDRQHGVSQAIVSGDRDLIVANGVG